jgi:hypothetical protein
MAATPALRPTAKRFSPTTHQTNLARLSGRRIQFNYSVNVRTSVAGNHESTAGRLQTLIRPRLTPTWLHRLTLNFEPPLGNCKISTLRWSNPNVRWFSTH